MASVRVSDRRRIEVALLRLMPSAALLAWQDRCQYCQDSASESRVWRYWHAQLTVVRGILEDRSCPPPREPSAPRCPWCGVSTDDGEACVACRKIVPVAATADQGGPLAVL